MTTIVTKFVIEAELIQTIDPRDSSIMRSWDIR